MARQVYLSGRRRRCDDIWPIDPSIGRPPANWPGWPGGKRFAFVLTHDVEGESGLQKCAQLMETERAIGFRSCFNFIPEGEYDVTPELRSLLAANDFEVGVHDLYHDGKLYRSREGFRRNAELINKYLDAWGAVGFRSGFMHHNLEWLHDLNITYDCSTFDTDPFEPQPDGVGTIFPFWVPAGSSVNQCFSASVDRNTETPKHRSTEAPAHRTTEPPASHLSTGYLELPYTLPQDSTVFLLFNQGSIDTWKLKLEWVVSQGGMALLNVHPDYMHFESDRQRGPHYPATLYREFLSWAREKYDGQYWQALPREVAAYCSAFRPQRSARPRRVCMLTHSYYRTDARVTRYAEALANRGDHVDVVALSGSPDAPPSEQIRGVNLVRLQKRFGKTEKSRMGFLVPILRFLVKSSLWIARNHRRKPYDLLHIHNIPDFLVFAAWYPKCTGAKVILDIHDIVPEFYASKFNRPASSWGIRMLKIAEWLSARVADHVIIANHLWLEKYATRTGKDGACSVYINNVDTQIFTPRPRTRTDGKTIILFPGGLQWHQGLDIAIRAFARVLAVTAGTSVNQSVSEPVNRSTEAPVCSSTEAPKHRTTGSSASVFQSSGDSVPNDRSTETPVHRNTEAPNHRNTETPPPGSELSTLNSQLSTASVQACSALSTLNSQLSTNLEFHIYGDGNMKSQLIALAKELGLEEKVRFFKPLPVRQISEIMANADLGVVPKRADSFGNEAYSTKIMEFMSLGVPVVVSSTKIDRYYFDDTVVRFFPSGDHDAMARQILDLLTDTAARERQVAKAMQYAITNSWDNRKHDYLALVDSLIDGRTTSPTALSDDLSEEGAARPRNALPRNTEALKH